MSEDNYQNSAARRNRVQKLKKIIILLLMVCITIPILCCVILFVQVRGLNKRLCALESQVATLTQSTLEQQQRLQEWFLAGELSNGQGEATKGQAAGAFVDVNGMEAADVIEGTRSEALHKVYLTFDDGPSQYTEQILEILDRYDVKATFFVVGKEGRRADELLCRIAEEGHSLGLHSYSHKYSDIYDSVEAFAEDFQKLQDHVYQVTGQKSRIYRFPGGSSNTVSNLEMYQFAEYLAGQGVEFYDWNISSGDGGSKLLDVETLVKNATTGITDRETSIILLHDAKDKTTTIEALPIIIENILAMEDTVILPITEDTRPVQHIDMEVNK